MFTYFLQGFFWGLGFLLSLIALALLFWLIIFQYREFLRRKYFKEAFLRAAESFIKQLEEQELYIEVQDFQNILKATQNGNIGYDYLSKHYEIISKNRYIVEEDESIREILVEYIKKK